LDPTKINEFASDINGHPQVGYSLAINYNGTYVVAGAALDTNYLEVVGNK
jgi:hypothetical protein